MTSMKEQTFGIELEMNGILRTKAAKVIAEHFGTTPSMPDHTCYHTQTVRMPDGRVWKVMRDASIPGPDSEKTGAAPVESVLFSFGRKRLTGPERKITMRLTRLTVKFPVNKL